MTKAVLLLLCIATLLCAQSKPQSWKDIANDAVMKGDCETAIRYYQKWVEADPSDAISLYNLACCFALGGKTKDALESLRKSAAAGWSDSVHTESDPDLNSLHGEADFAKLLAEIARNARLRSEGYTAHYCAQERMGKYLVILPEEYDPARRYPLVVLLHGHGQNPEFFARVAQWLSPGERIFVIPQGPYTAGETEGKGFTHFRERDDYSEDLFTAQGSADWVVRVMDDALKRYPIQDSAAIVIGFSQGGALAHLVAAYHPTRVKAYAAVGGYFIPHLLTPATLKGEAEAKVRALIVHDLLDPAVPFDEAAYAHNMLQTAGVDVTIAPLEKFGHTFTPEVGMKIDEWLRK